MHRGRDRTVVEFITTYNVCNQCLSPLKLWVRIPLGRGVLDTTLCNKNVYSATFYLLNDTQLQSFQFKINHIIIFTNHLLMKCKLSETTLCTFCNDAIEKIVHLIWECQYAKNIWISLASYLQKSLNLKLDMDPFVCMFNCYSGDLPLYLQFVG